MNRKLSQPLWLGAVVAGAFMLAQCQTSARAVADPEAMARSAAAWTTVYRVLQHPRCVNCHPAGDAPLVGEDSQPHPQGVQRGSDGMGRFAMTCPTCHQQQNTPGAHMPPGGPRWHLPPARTPLVFEGRSEQQLAQQLADPQQNGGMSPAELLQHVREAPLVLWGWDPGEGREPVPLPHDQFVAAFQAWVDGGCQVPGAATSLLPAERR